MHEFVVFVVCVLRCVHGMQGPMPCLSVPFFCWSVKQKMLRNSGTVLVAGVLKVCVRWSLVFVACSALADLCLCVQR